MKLAFQAQLTKVESRQDRTLKLTLGTQELPPEEAGQLMSLANEQVGCALAAADTPLEASDIPEPLDDAPAGKSPSQRLRNTLFRFWEQRGSKGSFERFYLEQMEELINRVKARLDD
jgi:hypothetical protein